MESHLHSLEIRIPENSGHAVVIADFYLQMNARRHDFRGARRMRVDGVTSLFPRLDVASGGFAFDLVSDRDNAATELFGKLSKTDLIAVFDEDFIAMVGSSPQRHLNRRTAPAKIEESRCLQASKTRNPSWRADCGDQPISFFLAEAPKGLFGATGLSIINEC